MSHSQTAEKIDIMRASVTKTRGEQSVIEELVKVLAPHPSGLRRWSVMRAIRVDRERAMMDVSPKFEDDIERVFRRFCAGYGDGKSNSCPPEKALFHRPAERAGEVWAVHHDRAKAWLAGDTWKV
ncbi:MAG: hypothetical protein ABSD74_14635 [Rhizomicrobium sp.]|jgi:hypothetical protein